MINLKSNLLVGGVALLVVAASGAKAQNLSQYEQCMQEANTRFASEMSICQIYLEREGRTSLAFEWCEIYAYQNLAMAEDYCLDTFYRP